MTFKELKEYKKEIKIYDSILNYEEIIEEDIDSDLYIGNININSKGIHSLEGISKEIQGDFYCDNNVVKTLKYSPKKVSGDYYIRRNMLESLKGCPQKVYNFNCDTNLLKSLEFGPKIVTGFFSCEENMLETLKGAPKEIKDTFNCSSNSLTSLEGCPKIGKNFNCSNNFLKDLKYSPEFVDGIFNCSNNKLTSLKERPKKISRHFICDNNKELKNVKNQIIKYGIKANYYKTDEGEFSFQDIEKEFNKYKEDMLKNENTKLIIKEKDFGLSIC